MIKIFVARVKDVSEGVVTGLIILDDGESVFPGEHCL